MMLSRTNKDFHADHWMLLFILVHLVCFTVVPALVRYNLPLDAIEGTIWAQQLQWGYDKNPFLNAWLSALAIQLGGQSGWMLYLFSQLCIITALWAVYQLAKQMLPPIYAFIAAIILEGTQYYNYHAIDFSDNTLLLCTWTLTIYFFYRALRTTTLSGTANKLQAWMLTGFFSGLGLLAKYYMLILLAAMAIFFFIHPDNRKQVKSLPPYLGLLVMIIIISPHLIWLTYHDFITITYVYARVKSSPEWLNHFTYPAKFLWEQLFTFSPTLLLFALLFLGKKKVEATHLNNFNKAFLFYIGLLPLVITLSLSILFGIKLRAAYGTPLLSLWSIMLLAAYCPSLTKTKLYSFVVMIYLLMAASLSVYVTSLVDSPDPSSANFPGQDIAQQITREWHDKYHTKLSYVAGSRWIGGNVGFYSTDHPSVFVEWNKRRAPWINVADLEEKGGVFLWCITDEETLPSEIANKFPQLTSPKILTISLLRNKRNLSPIKIGMAYLPPHAKKVQKFV